MNGVIILALKKATYAMGAFNLATSIKHFNPGINITLVSDLEHQKHFLPEHYQVFDSIKQMDHYDYTDRNNRFQPGLAKLNVYKYSDYDYTLYIDADSLALKDIQPFIDHLILSKGVFYSQFMGRGGKADSISYSPWATNEQIWNYFSLSPDTTITTVNSSWFFFTKKAESFFKKSVKNFNNGFKEEDLQLKWGTTLPDELFLVGTLAQMGIDPNSGIDAMFFGGQLDSRTLHEIEKDQYFITLYGGVGSVKDPYVSWYDRLMFRYCESKRQEHRFKGTAIVYGKHVNR